MSQVRAHSLTASNLQDVGHQVITLNHKILDDSIDHWVTVLNSGNWDVADALEGERKDDLGEILDQMRLEGWLAVLVVAKVVEELLHGVGKLLVQRILVELIRQELGLVNDAVSVVAVTVAKEEVATIIERVPLLGCLIFHDVALLLEAFSDIRINLLEPRLELGVLVGIAVDLVDGVEKILGRCAVGESFDQSLELGQCGLVLLESLCIPLGQFPLSSSLHLRGHL
jgi:hypothetical protein